jgi:hypothetical protein
VRFVLQNGPAELAKSSRHIGISSPLAQQTKREKAKSH